LCRNITINNEYGGYLNLPSPVVEAANKGEPPSVASPFFYCARL